jgi:hypothetical protein
MNLISNYIMGFLEERKMEEELFGSRKKIVDCFMLF